MNTDDFAAQYISAATTEIANGYAIATFESHPTYRRSVYKFDTGHTVKAKAGNLCCSRCDQQVLCRHIIAVGVMKNDHMRRRAAAVHHHWTGLIEAYELFDDASDVDIADSAQDMEVTHLTVEMRSTAGVDRLRELADRTAAQLNDGTLPIDVCDVSDDFFKTPEQLALRSWDRTVTPSTVA